MSNFKDLLGVVLTSIEGGVDSVELIFTTSTGTKYVLSGAEDMCTPYIESIVGDLQDLIGSPILLSDEATGDGEPPVDQCDEYYTWTFYRLATIKGYVDIRWYGSSNGCYSESVYFEIVN